MVEVETGIIAWIAAGAMCAVGLWCCCCIPLCMDSLEVNCQALVNITLLVLQSIGTSLSPKTALSKGDLGIDSDLGL